MRTLTDRLRHALSFEILGVLLITPLAALALDHGFLDLGVVTVGSATLAMLWNYAYNWLFDHAMQWLSGGTQKGIALRVVHVLLFELGLLTLLAPFIAWWLEVGLWQAVLLDLGFAGFYVVYAFAFNWGYDRLFPLPEWQQA